MTLSHFLIRSFFTHVLLDDSTHSLRENAHSLRTRGIREFQDGTKWKYDSIWCPERDLNPHIQRIRDFESLVSTISPSGQRVSSLPKKFPLASMIYMYSFSTFSYFLYNHLIQCTVPLVCILFSYEISPRHTHHRI